MDITTAKKVANLARLKLSDENEATTRAQELSGILEFVEQLNDVNTDGVVPLPNPNDNIARLREDEEDDGDTGNSGPVRVLSNAPESNSDYYVVPKVVE